MEKRQLIFWLSVALIWLGWFEVVRWMNPNAMKPPAKPPVAKVDGEPPQAPAKEDAPAKDDGQAKGEKPPQMKAADDAKPEEKPAVAVEPKAIPVRNDLALGVDDPRPESETEFYATLTNSGAAVTYLQLNRFKNENRSGPLVMLHQETPGVHSFLLDLGVKEEESLETKVWEVVEADAKHVVFRTTALGGKLAIEKRYAVNNKGPALDLELVFENLTDAPIDVKYSMTGGNGVPIEGKWYTYVYRNICAIMDPRGGGQAYYVEKTAAEAVTAVSREKRPPSFSTNEANAIQCGGIASQYFASLVVQMDDPQDHRRIASVEPAILGPIPKEKDQHGLTNVTVRVAATPIKIDPKQKTTHKYLLYNGPKRTGVLAAYDQFHLPLIVHYANFAWIIPVGAVAQFMVWLLETLHVFFNDYGLAIIFMTILVRICLFPLSFRATKSMQKMQELQPEIQKLKEKYGNDKEKLNRAQMDLFAKHKVNPVGGCLPMLLQLPIFIGLYQSLQLSFELRQAPFLFGWTWIKDLSAPDQLFPFGVDIPFLGPYFNLLPILAIVQMQIQMRLSTPPATTPEMALQKRLMTIMMAVMGVLFYKVPAGLCLYILTSSGWSMMERKFLPKANVPATGAAPGSVAAPAATAAASSTDGNGAASWKVSTSDRKKGKAKR